MRKSTLRGVFVVLGLCGATAFGAGDAQAAKEPKKPNVIIVFPDQLRSHELSCYGGQNIQTPNMDRLAEQGVRLTQALSTYPICSPYRAMMLTGLYPWNSGVTNCDHPWKPTELPSFAHAFNAAGYHTAYIGKWHLDGRSRNAYIPPERRLGFEHFKAFECSHNYFKSPYFDNNDPHRKIWPGYDAEAQTEDAIEYIRTRDSEQPFFMVLAWGPPHDPYVAPKEFMDQVDPDELILRPNVLSSEVADALIQSPRFKIPPRFGPMRTKRLGELRSEASIRSKTAGYLAATKALDTYLGRLLDALEAEGLADDTIIVFTADHGDQLGSHGFIDKNLPFEESISIPFLLSYPRTVPAGLTSDVLFEPVDVLPTVLGFAGVEIPQVDGIDKHAVILGEEEDATEAVLLMSMTHFNTTSLVNGLDTYRGLRTKRYTYARYEDGTPWLLYDNDIDPYQLNNLVNHPEQKSLIERLNEQTDQLLLKAGDPEDTRMIYDRIIKENPKRNLLLEMRKANPGQF